MLARQQEGLQRRPPRDPGLLERRSLILLESLANETQGTEFTATEDGTPIPLDKVSVASSTIQA